MALGPLSTSGATGSGGSAASAGTQAESGAQTGSGAQAGNAPQAGSGAQAGSGGTPAVHCGDTYPRLVSPGAPGGTVCAAGFARGRMSQALCSCGDLGTVGGLRTDAFDSDTEIPTLAAAAAVGVNGAYSTPAITFVGGSFTVAASTALLLLSPLDVRRDLRVGGALTAISTLTVGRDAWFADSTNAPPVVGIGGDVHQVPGKTLGDTIAPGTAGQVISEPFSVAAPCRCAPDEVTDWSDVIGSAADQNDNASIGLTPTAFLEPSAPLALTLPCGTFYIDGVASSQPIELTIVGRVALLVAGDVLTSAELRVTLEPGAELDWFIGGRLDSEQALVLGDVARPAALRVYVAGAGELSVRSQESVSANIYAPNADVQIDGKGDFSGSIFARTISSAKLIGVHYDVAVQRVAESCAQGPEPESCSGCGQCAEGKACVDGSCTTCAADGDCCWPLICNGGRCAAFKE